MISKSFKNPQLKLLLLPPQLISYKSHLPESNKARLLIPSPFSSSIERNEPTNPKLTADELTRINLLIPRLCHSDQLPTALHLTTTALHTNPPTNSISLSILIHSLTSQPDLTQPMSLLTRLRHTTSAHSHVTPIVTMLITSYLKKGRHKDGLKIYNWVRRPGSPFVVEPVVYGVLVHGFCKDGFVVEGLRILRDMLSFNLVPGGSLRKRVFRSLLMEARVKEGNEVDEGLRYVGDGGVHMEKVITLLDQIIANWTD